MENESKTTTSPADESTQTNVNFDDGWDDEVNTGEATQENTTAQTSTEDGKPADEDTPKADDVNNEPPAETDAQKQADDKEKTSAAQEETPGAEQPSAPKIHVKYMDTEKDLSPEEAQTFAQKGMDYDRVRQKYDESKPIVDLMKSLAEKSGMKVPDFVSYIRQQAKQQEGMSESEAKNAIALEDREAEVSRKEAEQAEREKAQKDTDQQENRVHEEIQKFIEKYPDVKPESVPQEVWQKMAQGESLVESYQDYLLTNAKAEADAAKQAAENSKASAGSMKSAGNPNPEKDPMDAGWDT